jgi:hypothetical protein
MAQGKLDNETKKFYEQSLAINLKFGGPNGTETSRLNFHLGDCCIYVYIYICIYTYMRKHMYICIHVWMNISM